MVHRHTSALVVRVPCFARSPLFALPGWLARACPLTFFEPCVFELRDSNELRFVSVPVPFRFFSKSLIWDEPKSLLRDHQSRSREGTRRRCRRQGLSRGDEIKGKISETRDGGADGLLLKSNYREFNCADEKRGHGNLPVSAIS